LQVYKNWQKILSNSFSPGVNLQDFSKNTFGNIRNKSYAQDIFPAGETGLEVFSKDPTV
jgi:hypothetical protein